MHTPIVIRCDTYTLYGVLLGAEAGAHCGFILVRDTAKEAKQLLTSSVFLGYKYRPGELESYGWAVSTLTRIE